MILSSHVQQDIETFDLEDFKYNGVNITAFRLVNVDSYRYTEVMEQMMEFKLTGNDILDGTTSVQV